mmetsp:Transcript_20598/g.29549  ORF Transcript_20598/g.29549 Transcript_20598/m.29549 type:complete len:396 (-) Transcript_20598:163-1350(-)
MNRLIALTLTIYLTHIKQSIGQCLINPTDSVQAFYYLWYGNPEHDGQWSHWDHEVLPHWTESVNKRYPTVGTRFSPPERIHSPYYPLRGPYSSTDETIIREQFMEMKDMGVRVAVLSWWGQKSRAESADTQGVSTDRTIPTVLSVVESVGDIRVAFHLEPYPGRTALTTLEDINYIHDHYGNFSSLYRTDNGRLLFYVYDSYHIPVVQWKRIFSVQGDHSIRGTSYDACVIGLWLDRQHGSDLHSAGFDGVYTYFASDGFSYGSTVSNWNHMCRFARQVNMLCVLSVGPGYQDDKIRPWNHINTKPRDDGAYYDHMWNAALQSAPQVVTITSYNEWGEGTQIEPARACSDSDSEKYLDYSILGSFGYVNKTSWWAKKFIEESMIMYENIGKQLEL